MSVTIEEALAIAQSKVRRKEPPPVNGGDIFPGDLPFAPLDGEQIFDCEPAAEKPKPKQEPLQEPLQEPPAPLPFVNMGNWDSEPIPQYEWSVHNRFPLRQTVLFSGAGAAGKGTVMLHLCAAHVLGRDWLSSMPEIGPAIFLDAEDDETVMHIRLAAICSHYRVTFKDLINGGLHLVTLVGDDAVLGAPTRSGLIEPTSRYKQLLQAAGDIKPKMIAISSSADVFAGNENDRPQVRQFISMLNKVAIAANGTVALISHPSLTGIASKTGISGSTQWHNSVRARAYMTSTNDETDEQPDTELREITFKKNQYGPIGDRIVLKFHKGMFLPVPSVSTLDRAAREEKAERVFVELLQRFTNERRNVGEKTGPNYAPAIFAKEQEATDEKIGNEDLCNAMRRLFRAGKIINEPYGRSDRDSFRIAIKTGE